MFVFSFQKHNKNKTKRKNAFYVSKGKGLNLAAYFTSIYFLPASVVSKMLLAASQRAQRLRKMNFMVGISVSVEIEVHLFRVKTNKL